MPDEIRRLPLLVQTAYTRVLDKLMTGDLSSSMSLVSKLINGKRYWYAQRTEDGKKVQIYLGRESPELEALVERSKTARSDAASRAELIAIARAGGAYVLGAAEARVLEMLSVVFRSGAVLVGSHAFAVFGNMLGVRWQDASVRTEDVDIAHDPKIAVALASDFEPIKLPNILGDALPLFSVLNPTAPATTFRVRNTEIEVDLLTPLRGRDTGRPIAIPALGSFAIPLRFLDYLIEESQPAAVLGGHGVLVNVPRPGRFALHKLIVAGRRGLARTKAEKDRVQATALLQVLLADLPGEIELAWKSLRKSKGWRQPLRQSLARLDKDLRAQLSKVGVT